ncbi:MAG: type II toxin-antitoxin system HicA family toxin [Candidatus Poribacteria bacterium]|nr:type II toxin-antitoxin system HicA family toxin [Candidatus Poribacteria bacterium]
MKYREIAKKLKKLGCVNLTKRNTGSHRKWHNHITGKTASFPDWGPKDLKTGTVRGPIKQLGIDWKEFEKTK